MDILYRQTDRQTDKFSTKTAKIQRLCVIARHWFCRLKRIEGPKQSIPLTHVGKIASVGAFGQSRYFKSRNDARGKNFFSPFPFPFSPRSAFTLSEVLLTLGIIGVVAALVIPAMIQNSQDAEYKTGKDKVRMSIAEAGKIMSVSGTITDGSSAQDFVENHLSKQLKIIKFCAPAQMEQCGMPSGNPTTFKDLYNNVKTSMPTTWTTITDPYDSGTWDTNNPTTQNFNNSYVFLSADGIAVNLFYNPYCKSFDEETQKNDVGNGSEMTALDMACMAGVYDMNGLKKPNQVGRDIGFFATLYNGIGSTSVATLPSKTGIDEGLYDWTTADNYCRKTKGQKLPTIDELSTLYLGKSITGLPILTYLWSASSLGSSSYARLVGFEAGGRQWIYRSAWSAVRCVRD